MSTEIKISDTGEIIGAVSDTYTPISHEQGRAMIGAMVVEGTGHVRVECSNTLVPFEQAKHYGQCQIRYLDASSVIATRQTEAPLNRSRSGYGSKIPTPWQVQLTDKRWRRVYVVCWSNSGSAYICTKAGCLYFGSFEPRDFKNS